jgi:hypothetical protein
MRLCARIALAAALSLVAPASVLAAPVKLPVHNATSQRVTLTVAPVACVNAVTGLNGKRLRAGAWHTGRVTLARSGDIVDDYAWDGNHGITPAYADGLLNEQVRGLLYSTLNTYLSDGKAHDATYERVKKRLSPSPRTRCSRATRAFAVGVDTRTRYVAALLKVGSSGRVSMASTIASDGLTLRVDGGGVRVGTAPRRRCPSMQDWMRCALPPGSAKARATPLYDLALPGSHDAGTSNLASSVDWVLAERDNRCSGLAWGSTPGPAIYNLAATQNQIMPEQLASGVRYLDLRTADDPGRGTDPGGTWRLVHTMFAQSTLTVEAEGIARWAAAHPDEIVIADFNKVCAGAAGDTSGFTDALTSHDPISGKSLCDVAYRTTDLPHLPAVTVQEVRDSGRNVIVLLDPANHGYATGECGFYPFYDQTQNNAAGAPGGVPFNHLWPMQNGPDAAACGPSAAAANGPAMAQMATYPLDPASPGIGSAPTLPAYRQADPVPFVNTQAQYTVVQKNTVIRTALACHYLERYEDYLDDHRVEVMIERWAPWAGVVIGDFVAQGGFINRVVAIEASRAAR